MQQQNLDQKQIETENKVGSKNVVEETQEKKTFLQQQPLDIHLQETNKQQLQQQQQQQIGLEEELKTKVKMNQNDQGESIIFFQDQGQLSNQDLLKSSPAVRDKFDTEFRLHLLTLVHDQQIINPLNFVINQKIEASNPEVMFYVLCDQLRIVDRQLFKSKQSDNLLMYSFQGQFTAESQDSQAYSLTLKETPNLTYKQIASDQEFRDKFIKKLITSLSKDLGIPEHQIQIVALEKGSIVVIFSIIDPEGIYPPPSEPFEEVQRQFPETAPSLSLYEYFKTAALSDDDFDPKYNMLWNDFVFGNYDDRGPQGKTQPYFFPVGWHGYGLNVAGKYGNNDNWLKMDNNKEEWYVMFHGTNFRAAPNILKQGFKTGSAQGYENERCLLTNNEIGKGVYFSNHVEVAEGYAEPTIIGNEKFVLAFQSRVRPEALRQCKKASDLNTLLADYKKNIKFQVESLKDMKMWDNDYFVVNNTRDIRPYRILIKQLPRGQ